MLGSRRESCSKVEQVGWATHTVVSLCASVVPVALTNPLDVLKVRLQSRRRLQLATRPEALLKEGLRGASAGTVLSFAGYTLSPTVKMTAYHMLGRAGIDNTSLKGVLCGLVTALVTSPLWVLKIRVQLQPGGGSIASAARDTLTKEGWRGFYSGVGAACANKGLEFCVFFTVYEGLKNMGGARDGQEAGVVMGAAGAARLCASIVAYPANVITTRMREPKAWRGADTTILLTCAQAYRSGALFSGLVPHLLRVIPFSSVYFLAYESLLTYAAQRRQQQLPAVAA